MEITAGAFDPVTGQIEVTFTVADHPPRSRPVAAALNADGSINEDETANRIMQVGLGMQHKFALGLFREMQPVAETIEMPPPPEPATPEPNPLPELAPDPEPAPE